jgi:tetratricopeptide (TPR) repeat protein
VADYDIFISHSPADDTFAQELATDLRLMGLDVFLAADSLASHGDFGKRLSALSSSRAAVVLMSADALASPRVLREAEIARRQAQTGSSLLIPVVLPGMEFSGLPQGLQHFSGLRLQTVHDGKAVARRIAEAVADTDGLGGRTIDAMGTKTESQLIDLAAQVKESDQAWGPQHPTSLARRANLAAEFRQTGRLEESLVLMKQAVEDSDTLLGPDHPTTTTLRTNLADVMSQLGLLDEASVLLERTIADGDNVLGSLHPTTFLARAKLADIFQQMNRWDEAATLLERTLTDSEAVLGYRHPTTLTVKANLAGALRELGRLDDAVVLMEQSLSDSRDTFGTDDVRTLTIGANLAETYQQLGRVEEAINLLKQTVADYERVLGPNHPMTLTAGVSLNSLIEAQDGRYP